MVLIWIMLLCMWQRTGYPRVVEQLVSIHAQCMPKSRVLFLNTSPYMCTAYCNCQVWILYMRCVLLVVISSSLLVMCRVHNTLRVLRMKWSEYGIFNLTYFFGVELSINWCWYHDAWTVIFFWCWGEDFDHGSTIRTTMLLVVAPKVQGWLYTLTAKSQARVWTIVSVDICHHVLDCTYTSWI